MERLTLMDALSVIPDPRVERTRKHNLVDIIVMTVCGVIAGCEGWSEIEFFAEGRKDWFEKFLELPHGIPSHDTFGRVFSLLDPEAFQRCFFDWLSSTYSQFSAPKKVHIDGKFLKGALKETSRERSAIQLVSAWSSDLGLCLGIKKSELKKDEGEKRMMEQLIECLYLKGCIVSLDANGATERIANAIVKKQADYVIGLKDNQSSLLTYAQLGFQEAQSDESYETTEKGHGRIEIRKYDLLKIFRSRFPTREKGWDHSAKKFPNLQSIIKVTSTRMSGDQQSTETRFFISTLTEVGKAADSIRSHWSVENNLHRTLDVTFNEDHIQIRKGHAAENLGLIRRMAINMLKKDPTPKKSIRRKQMSCMMDPVYLERVLELNAQQVKPI